MTTGWQPIYVRDEGAPDVVVTGCTFNTSRSMIVRKNTQFTNNTLNGAKGLTISSDVDGAVVTSNIFNNARLDVYPIDNDKVVIEKNQLLGESFVELEPSKTYTQPVDLSGNYWPGYETSDKTSWAEGQARDVVVVTKYDTTDMTTLTVGPDAVAQVGSAYYATLQAAIAAAADGETVTLLRDVELSTAGERISIQKSITLDGGTEKHAITGATAAVNRVIMLDGDGCTVNLKNLRVVGFDGGSSDMRGVSAYDFKNGTLNLDNVEVFAKWYGLNVAGDCSNSTVNVTNSTLSGWCAAQTHSADVTINVADSTLIGTNDKSYSAEAWNRFSTIVLNAAADNAKITVENSRIQVNVAEGEHNEQSVAALRNATGVVSFKNCSVETSGSYKQTANEGGETVALTPSNVRVTLEAGTLIVDDIEIPSGEELSGMFPWSGLKDLQVAKIGDKIYFSLQSAIDAAQTGETVILLRDTRENVTIAAGQDITLDLAGKTLNGGTVKKTAALTNNGTVVIVDSSEEKTGTIQREDTPTSGSAYYTVLNKGTMTLGEIKVRDNAGAPAPEWKGSSLVVNGDMSLAQPAVLIIDGADLEQGNFIALKNEENGHAVIRSGHIKSESQAIQNWDTLEIDQAKDKTVTVDGYVSTWSYNGAAPDPFDGASTTIVNGTINGDVVAEVMLDGADEAYCHPEIRINGGVVNGEIDVTGSVADSVRVSGGVFQSDVDDYCVEGYRALQDAQGKFVVTAHGESDHVWDDGEQTKDPTCAAKGETTYTCTLCGDTKVEEVDVIDHDFTQFQSWGDWTAEEGGYTRQAVVKCAACDATENQDATVTVETVAATCKDAGSNTYTSTWGEGESAQTDTKVDEIEKLTTHTPGQAVQENVVNASCSAEGSYEAVVYCTVCQTEVSRESKTIDKLAHTEVVDAAVAPTCTEAGKIEGKHCSVCNEVLTAQETVAATGHTLEWAHDDDGHWQKCANCDHTETAEAHTWRSVGVSGGVRTETCDTCGAERIQRVNTGSGGGYVPPTVVTRPTEELDDPDTPLAEKPFLFTDVDEAAWYYDAVKYVFDNDLMKGTSETVFSPNVDTDRGMIVTMLYRLEQEPQADVAKLFPDVALDRWYTDAVAWGVPAGIVKGYDDGNFGPEDKVTREQLALFLLRYAQLKGYDVTGRDELDGFTDSQDVSAWALDAVQWAVSAGLLKGDNGALQPGDNATRAEAAAMFARFAKTFAPAEQ